MPIEFPTEKIVTKILIGKIFLQNMDSDANVTTDREADFKRNPLSEVRTDIPLVTCQQLPTNIPLVKNFINRIPTESHEDG